MKLSPQVIKSRYISKKTMADYYEKVGDAKRASAARAAANGYIAKLHFDHGMEMEEVKE